MKLEAAVTSKKGKGKKNTFKSKIPTLKARKDYV